jgi:hypothetical protein
MDSLAKAKNIEVRFGTWRYALPSNAVARLAKFAKFVASKPPPLELPPGGD